jgi:SPX domain protein involved in polyphosphate accumulation/uncharacterized membrane protein YidH (DUF202 family)
MNLYGRMTKRRSSPQDVKEEFDLQCCDHSAFSIHTDALYNEISIEIKRASTNQLDECQAKPGSSTSFATNFLDLFEAEISRVSHYVASQKESLELSAKSLLVNSEAYRANLQDNATNNIDTSQALRDRSGHLVDSCLKLRWFMIGNAEILTTIADYADSQLPCTWSSALLESKLLASPWKGGGPSSSLIVLMSDMYENIRVIEGKQNSADDSKGPKWEAPSSFERTTTKYLVHQDKMTDLLLNVVQEAPLLVYGQNGRLTTKEDLSSKWVEGYTLWDSFGTTISSVYFDSPDMDMYKARLARKEGAQLLRARWYGEKPCGCQSIFLELKTHHEKWINTKSVKERVAIQEKDMGVFLSAEEWTTDVTEALVLAAAPSLTDAALIKAAKLMLKMHELVAKHDLCPCVRSTYLRAAFQSPESNALRLTVDRDVTLIDETATPSGMWCLPEDVIADNPSMVKRVPFPVFEVKLAGEDMPKRIQGLIDGGIIDEAAKFSKFLTGAACFNKENLTTLPYWAGHPAFAEIFGLSTTPAIAEKPLTPCIRLRVSDAGERENTVYKTSATSETPASSERKVSVTSRKKYYFAMSSSSIFGSSTRLGRTHSIASKTRVRIEPKSYFANERTFIQWISAALFLITIAVLLIEYGSAQPNVMPIGYFLIGDSIFIVVYSLFVYYRRVYLLSTGKPFGYIDMVGPLLLAGSVLIGISILLVYFVRADSTPAVITEDSSHCYLHTMRVSRLIYQPSDVVADGKNKRLLVPSGSQITALSTASDQHGSGVKVLAEIRDTDLEAITIVDDRVFVVSEGLEDSELIELRWEGAVLSVVHRWRFPAALVEAITFVPSTRSSNGAKGSLFVASANKSRIGEYELPSLDGTWAGSKINKLNTNLLGAGLVDSKISALQYFEGKLYVLHDNARVVRVWDPTTGDFLSEWELPRTESGFDKQWEGMALERVEHSGRGSLRASSTSDDSSLVLHLALDTPPQVWSLVVTEGATPGLIQLPSCAAP